ncbi:FMN-linked oxidoreductase [Xylaria scruposa]|nr:FMN-linked oxidoreductase [Xylaria scruposa]
MAESRLFKPLRIGNVEVKHRIGMAPLTRRRATSERVPTPMMKEYYSQRASVPGTFIISEGVLVSPAGAGGYAHVPGIWNQDQVAAWKTITDEIHRKGCFVFCQLFAMGRTGDVETAKKDGVDIIGPSAIPVAEGAPTPRAMTIEEIRQMTQDFATASENAIKAGFDGVECHGANGYLLDQFLHDTSNTRNDEYGGNVANRSRFLGEVMKAMVDAIGPERVGLRLSPWSTFQVVRMENPIPQFVDIINKASKLNLAYLHLVESRVFGHIDCEAPEKLDFAYDIWKNPVLVAGGYTPANAQKVVDEEYPNKDIMVIIGRHFVSNPDLVYRYKKGLKLNAYDRDTFYAVESSVGYVDYPFSEEYLASMNA